MTSLRIATSIIAAFVGNSAAAGAQEATLSARDLAPKNSAASATETSTASNAMAIGAAAIGAVQPSADPLDGITVGAIRVDGLSDIPQSQFAAAIGPYLGRTLSSGETQDLLGAVSAVARRNGYIFATSSIPAQRLAAGVLTVHLSQGVIDEIRLQGDQLPQVAALLQPLIGKPARFDDLDRMLTLAADFPGVAIGKVRYAKEKDRGILIVPVERERVRGWAQIDNRGSQALGPVRAQIGVDFSDLLSSDDRITLQGVVTPTQPNELGAIYGRYGIMLANASTEIALSAAYSRTDFGGRWARFDPNGNSIGFNVSVTQTLLRGRRQSLWAALDFNYLSSNQYWNGSVSLKDRIASIGASINGYSPLAGGRLRAGLGVRRGVLAFGTTAPGDPLASRYGAGSDYTILRGWTSWEGPIGGPVSARFALSAQLSTDPLLAADQITIGGPDFGRAYEFGERTGDEGILASGELRADIVDRNVGLLRWIQVYAFGDGGDVTNLRAGYGTGDLYSAGWGARFLTANQIRFGVETAFPVKQRRYETEDFSPRISASIGVKF